jgi:hypothetical protein
MEQFEGGNVQIRYERPTLAILKSNEHIMPQGHDQPRVANVVVRPTAQDEPEGQKRLAMKAVPDVVGSHAGSIHPPARGRS